MLVGLLGGLAVPDDMLEGLTGRLVVAMLEVKSREEGILSTVSVHCQFVGKYALC